MRQFRAKSEGIRETFKSGFKATKAAVFFANFIFQAHSSVLFGYCIPAPNQLKHKTPVEWTN